MIARCMCGRVEYELTGHPIVSLVCYCKDCQLGSQMLEALEGAGRVRDEEGGTAYVNYRKDRVTCTRGAELLEDHKLDERSATSRVAARCCNAAMLMRFDDARHWIPVYRARLGEDAPVAEMRICTKTASEVPSYPGYPLRLLAKLVAARLAMLIGR